MIGGKIKLEDINTSIEKIRKEINDLRILVDQFNEEQAKEAVKQDSFYHSVKTDSIKLGSTPFDISIEDAVNQLIKKRDQLQKNKWRYKDNINSLNTIIRQIYDAKSKPEIIKLLNSAPSGTWKNKGFNGGMKTKRKRKRKAKKYSHKK